jgi:hypothetical protein
MATSDTLVQLQGTSQGKVRRFGRELFSVAHLEITKIRQGFRSNSAPLYKSNDRSLKDIGETSAEAEFEAPGGSACEEAFKGTQLAHPWHSPANCSPQILLAVGPR